MLQIEANSWVDETGVDKTGVDETGVDELGINRLSPEIQYATFGFQNCYA